MFLWLDRLDIVLMVSSSVVLGGLQHLRCLRAEEAVAVSAGRWDLSSPLAAAVLGMAAAAVRMCGARQGCALPAAHPVLILGLP